MTADALATCVVKSLATMELTIQDKHGLVFYKDGFQLPKPSQCQEMTHNANTFSIFSPINSVQRGLLPAVLLTIVHDAELQLSVHPALVSSQREVLEGLGVILLHPLAVHIQ